MILDGGGTDDRHGDGEGGLLRCSGVNMEEINRLIL